MEDVDHFPGHLEVLDPDIATRMDSPALRRSQRMAFINSRYLSTRRDAEIATELDLLIGGAVIAVDGYQTERRCLAIIGETGAGKTRAITRAIGERAEFQPRDTEMTRTAPLLRVKAPSPCSLKALAYEILEALEYPLQRELKATPAWKMVRRQLKAKRVRFVLIDEAQHMVNLSDRAAMQELSDALKMVMEDAAWPVNLILTGMPELADFLSIYGQIARRTHKVVLADLDMERDSELVEWVVKTIVEKHAGMGFSRIPDHEYLCRLCHGAHDQFGTLTQLVRGAIERALVRDPETDTVRPKDFERSYAIFSGCKPAQNVMAARNWQEIHPANALLREEELARDSLLAAMGKRGSSLKPKPSGKGGRA